MKVQRTVSLLLPDDDDLRQTLTAFQRVQQALSPICQNEGRPLGRLALQRAAYHSVKGTLNAQMTISAIRSVAAAYASAISNGHEVRRPFRFKRPSAVFLVGKRGRDASFCSDGTLSIWTVNGRKRIPYTVPEPHRGILTDAVDIDSLTVIERKGVLLARATVTLLVPEPHGRLPVGVDLNETNALVAVDMEDREFFISGKPTKVANARTRKTRQRLKKKLAARKAEKKDTRSVRRLLKRLGRKQRNRTRTFAQTTSKRLVQWVPPDTILVFEELDVPEPKRGKIAGKALRRRLSQWQRSAIRRSVICKAQETGSLIEFVDPRYTSKICSRCGLLGKRKRHRFCCPHCGLQLHADVNAARNIRNRSTVLRCGGHPSVCPEALVKTEGKLSAVADGH